MKTDTTRELTQKLLFSLLVFTFMINNANSQAYKVRMAMMGNSITYGANLSSPATECYPAQLGLLLEGIYGDTCEIKNYGVSGRTMMRSSESPLWNESEFLSALKYVPDICLIFLGTNDSKPYRWDAWGDEFLGDYFAMIDTFKFRNPNTRFIACYPTPIWEGHPYGTTFSDSHNDSIVVNHIIPAIDTVVEETGAILIDLHTPFVDSLQLFPDKLHPNALGSYYIAEIIYNKIIDTDLIHQVEAGLTYVSFFEQVTSPAAIGSEVEMRWATLFADSVFFDSILVDNEGSMKVIAEENKVYTITAKGSKNTSEFPLHLETYIPVKTNLFITTSSSDYSNGSPVVLYVQYTDQLGRVMDEKTQDVTWTIIEGNGKFEDQTDTSIVFIPVEEGKVTVEAKEGEFTKEKVLNVRSFPTVVRNVSHKDVNVFPNPVNENLFFQIENFPNKTIQVSVFSLLGVQLLERNLTAEKQDISTFKLNTSDIKPGVYIYVISIDKETLYGQFIKIND